MPSNAAPFELEKSFRNPLRLGPGHQVSCARVNDVSRRCAFIPGRDLLGLSRVGILQSTLALSTILRRACAGLALANRQSGRWIFECEDLLRKSDERFRRSRGLRIRE